MEDRTVSPAVRGRTVDDETRCVHYATVLDVVAIRFHCCDAYWPCAECHEEGAGHEAVRVPVADRDRPGILCGVCRHELSVTTYLRVEVSIWSLEGH
ncbi:putative CHY-type Zn-finger protein [Pseudoclavibacter chungangensis]|uniref:CHY zinc finger protein n=1 Tax=Pseudoclavibacter chungangensis TaxID=587635 RepID=UPI001800FC16|nr:CHY zinc finger protein [Pseudoclavibacter chungangensis]NYJ65565.1 putative CHY-type Zn-finger protein [Pseudoclavibacter chungangensis]